MMDVLSVFENYDYFCCQSCLFGLWQSLQITFLYTSNVKHLQLDNANDITDAKIDNFLYVKKGNSNVSD